jgi:hypothetical protein
MPKDQSEIASPSDDNNNNNVRVVFEVKLRRRDQRVPRRVTIANEVVECMSETFQRGNFFAQIKGEITLKINIVACSEGNRCCRIFFAETCVGWVILDCEWLLMRGDVKLTEPKTEKLRWSGMTDTQCLDVCDENYGQYDLLNDLCYKMAEQIGEKSAKALRKL